MANDHEMLSDAIARNSAMVLSLPSAGMLRHYKSRFLSEDDAGLWVESVPGEQSLIQSLVGSPQKCGVSFKCGDKRVAFASEILIYNAEYRVNETTLVQALQLREPATIKATQRRNNYRAQVREDAELTVRVWRIADQADLRDTPMSTAELNLSIRDLSSGGMGVTVTFGEHEHKLLDGQRLRIQLCYQGAQFLLEGRTRPPQSTSQPRVFRLGVQFQGLQEGINGRQTQSLLAKILSDLQRQEARRHRMGVA